MRPRTEIPGALAGVGMAVLLWLVLGWAAVAIATVFMLACVFVGVASARRRY